MIEAVNRAMMGLDAYWARHGTPDSRVIAQVHAKLEERSATCDDDWQALLVDVMHDLGYDIELRGEDVHALGAVGVSGELVPHVAHAQPRQPLSLCATR